MVVVGIVTVLRVESVLPVGVVLVVVVVDLVVLVVVVVIIILHLLSTCWLHQHLLWTSSNLNPSGHVDETGFFSLFNEQ